MKYYWICIFSLHNAVLSVDQVSASTCLPGKTCSDCIQQPDCVWCSDVNGLRSSRCRNSSYTDNRCDLEVSMKDLQNKQSDQCLCDQHSDKNAEICNHSGSLRCGACYCNPGYSGKFCQCLTPSADHNISSEYNAACKAPNDTKICSGRGSCICGKCECDVSENPHDYVYGLYCECNNFSCERNSEGILCGGTNSDCLCGRCVTLIRHSSSQMSILRNLKNYTYGPRDGSP